MMTIIAMNTTNTDLIYHWFQKNSGGILGEDLDFENGDIARSIIIVDVGLAGI